MTRGPLRTLVLTMLLGALALAGVAGVLAGAPAWRHSAVPAQVGPDQATPPADPSRPAQALADAPCRLTGTPLLAGGAAQNVLTSQLQNLGDVTATLQALQLGWESEDPLVEVLFKGTSVFSGTLASPALVPFPKGMQLAPHQRAELRIRTQGQTPGTPTGLLQAVLLLKEGCEVVLGPVAPNPCPLAVGPVEPSVDPRTRATFTLSNGGTEALLLSAIEITWPEEQNGALVELWMGGNVVHAFAERAPHSPANLNLRAILDKPVQLDPAARLVVGLGFEKAAAAKGYKVTVVTERGCAATNGAGADEPECGVQLGGFTTRDRVAVLHLTNMRRVPRQLAQLDVFWPAEVNGPLTAVLANGIPIWAGVATRSPASIKPTLSVGAADLVPGVSLGAGETLELQLVFAPTVVLPGPTPVTPQPTRAASQLAAAGADSSPPDAGQRADADPLTQDAGLQADAQRPLPSTKSRTATTADQSIRDGIAAGDYTVVAGLRDGCSAIFSTLRGQLDDGCTVSADALEVDAGQGEVRVNLTSTGAQASLRRLSLTWPLRNGALTGIFLGNVSLLAQPIAPQQDPVVVSVPGGLATLAPNGSRALRLTFGGRPAPNGYVFGLEFVGPAGQACDQLLVSAPAKPTECRVAMGDLTLLSPDAVSIELRNDGDDAVDLKFLNVDWPADRPDATLTEIALVHGDGTTEQVWVGAEKKPPVRLLPTAAKPPTLGAGERGALRLRFDQLRIGGGDETAFRATVGFNEGCQAAYAPKGGQILPERVTVSGFIKSIPDGTGGAKRLIGCCWLIQAQDREWILEVDGRTRFEPSSVVPKEGDVVVVQALVYSNGEKARYVAQTITFRNDPTPVLLIGPIGKVDDAHSPPEWLVVQGRVLTVLATTVIEGKLQIGALAQVKGFENEKGGVTAGYIKVESDGEPTLVQGTIQRARMDGADQLWWVDQFVVRCPAGLDWGGDSPPSAAAVPEPGRKVEIQGVLATGGKREVLAKRVTFLPVPKLTSVDGTLDAVPGGGLLGTWSIQTAKGDLVSFVVDAPNVVDTRRAPARRGVRVKAVVEAVAGEDVPTAVSVQLEWPD